MGKVLIGLLVGVVVTLLAGAALDRHKAASCQDGEHVKGRWSQPSEHDLRYFQYRACTRCGLVVQCKVTNSITGE